MWLKSSKSENKSCFVLLFCCFSREYFFQARINSPFYTSVLVTRFVSSESTQIQFVSDVWLNRAKKKTTQSFFTKKLSHESEKKCMKTIFEAKRLLPILCKKARDRNNLLPTKWNADIYSSRESKELSPRFDEINKINSKKIYKKRMVILFEKHIIARIKLRISDVKLAAILSSIPPHYTS